MHHSARCAIFFALFSTVTFALAEEPCVQGQSYEELRTVLRDDTTAILKHLNGGKLPSNVTVATCEDIQRLKGRVFYLGKFDWSPDPQEPNNKLDTKGAWRAVEFRRKKALGEQQAPAGGTYFDYIRYLISLGKMEEADLNNGEFVDVYRKIIATGAYDNIVFWVTPDLRDDANCLTCQEIRHLIASKIPFVAIGDLVPCTFGYPLPSFPKY